MEGSMTTSIAAAAAGFFFLAWLVTLMKLNRNLHLSRGRNLLWRWKIPLAPVEQIDPAFELDEFGTKPDAEVRFLAGHAPSSTSTHEAWILAVLSKTARRLFEFGTCSGRTAYLWALNSPPDAVVTTLTLPPDQLDRYQAAPHDDATDTANACNESRYTRFVYSGTDVEHKIEQLYADSKQFDPGPYAESFDLIFIDGSHAQSYVAGDSEKALLMLKPGGLLLWHDYRGPLMTKGVFRALNALADRLPLRRIENTSLVVYRKPAKEQEAKTQTRAA